jgi:hypothetical protein
MLVAESLIGLAIFGVAPILPSESGAAVSNYPHNYPLNPATLLIK